MFAASASIPLREVTFLWWTQDDELKKTSEVIFEVAMQLNEQRNLYTQTKKV